MKIGPERATVVRRIAAYWLTGIGFAVVFLWLKDPSWQGTADFHSDTEIVATTLAIIIGVMALARFHSKEDSAFLFIGAGFLGTAVLDAYHTVVTLEAVAPHLPSALPALAPWSWVASRLFLSTLMLLGVLARFRDARTGDAARHEQRTVYQLAAVFTLAVIVFFAVVPLRSAYFPEWPVSRPQELLPALFFSIAAAGCLKIGRWRHDAFEHWLILFLITSAVSQAFFMSRSAALFDYEFNVAHLLKILSYFFALIGLLGNVLSIYREAQRAETMFRGAIAGIQEGFALFDAEDRLVHHNDEYLRLHPKLGDVIKPGVRFEEIVRAGVARGQLVDAVGREEPFIRERLRLHRNPAGPILRELADGTFYLINEARMPDGGIAVTETDITELKEAEHALRDRERQLRTIMESSPIGIAVVLPAENKRLYVNPAMVHMYGAESVEQMIATEISNSFVNPDEFRRLQAGTGENLIREAVVERKRPDGSTWWCLLSRQPIVFQGKHAMMVWNWDITDRKRAEDALVAKEALTRRLLEASPVGVLIATREGQHLFANARALEIQGVTRDELFSHNAGVYYADPGLRTRMKDDLYATGSTPPTEVELVRPDGSHFIVVLSSTLIEFEGQRAHITYLYDISELKQTEQALRESRERTRAIVDNIIDGIVTIDAAGTILTINSKAAEIFGYAEHEMVGHNVDILMPEPHRGSRDRYAANYRTTGVAKFLGETRQIEGVRRDGRRFPMELAINAVPFGDERLFVGIVRDITEQKEMERLKGEFVSTVSHELRTPLTSIRGSLGLLTGGVVGKLPAKARAMIEMAEKNTERLINLVNDILDMEKLESGRMEFRFTRLDLGRLVEAGITANKGYADGFGVEFVLTGNDPDIFVRADNDRLTQVLTNLLSNAAKFSPKGGKVEVAVGSRKGWGCVSVRDHGPGIPDEFRDKIFGKFTQADSSDKRTAGGTGLGLNISKTIIEKHGGVIGFESGSGDGATFYFEVPAWRELPVKLGDPRMREGSRVLICEDDEDIAELLSLMLGRQGIISDIARTAGQARGLLAANAYDAMTLDLILPDQDGLSFIRDLRADARTRDLPVVVVSVLADEGRKAVRSGDAIGIVDWLVKPIDQKRLAAVIAGLGSVKRPGARLLYVEDEPDLVALLSALLGNDIQVVAAATLAEAKARLARERFDLVILDVGLPDGSGLDLLALLNRPGDGSVPVIILSADEIDPRAAANVNAAMVKSRSSNEQLVATIRSFLDKHPAVAE